MRMLNTILLGLMMPLSAAAVELSGVKLVMDGPHDHGLKDIVTGLTDAQSVPGVETRMSQDSRFGQPERDNGGLVMPSFTLMEEINGEGTTDLFVPVRLGNSFFFQHVSTVDAPRSSVNWPT